jgi:hypothetical protein
MEWAQEQVLAMEPFDGETLCSVAFRPVLEVENGRTGRIGAAILGVAGANGHGIIKEEKSEPKPRGNDHLIC